MLFFGKREGAALNQRYFISDIDFSEVILIAETRNRDILERLIVECLFKSQRVARSRIIIYNVVFARFEVNTEDAFLVDAGLITKSISQ